MARPTHFAGRHKNWLVLAALTAPLVYLVTLPATEQIGFALVRDMRDGRYLPELILAPMLLVTGIVLNNVLRTLDWRWLEWSLGTRGANVSLTPLTTRWLWLPYAMLLSACIPVLALLEELIFRYDTTGWVRGLLWGTIAFGVFHLLSAVTIRMAIYLSLVGALLVDVYMTNGLIAAFVLHATYNLLAVALVVADRHLRLAHAFLARAGLTTSV
jgi:hypothetical protein